jgi:hypothetical protein
MNMKYIQSLLALGLVLLLAATVQAKAAYKGKGRMIETAEVIAVVEITSVEKASVKGKHWIYGQRALAKVENVLKGKLPASASLYGDENFICARCHFEIGRYLVFLDRDGELLTGNNWYLSIRKITENSEAKVEWFDDKNIFEKKQAPLSDVLNEIAAVLAKPKQEKG